MFCIMKTACCGRPLRTVSLSLLYFHLFLLAIGLMRIMTKVFHNSDAQYYESQSASFVDIFQALEFFIVIAAIKTIHGKNPSRFLLFLATIYLYFLAFNSAYLMIAINSDDPVLEDKYKKNTSSRLSEDLATVNVIYFAWIVFEFYSGTVVYSYREELGQKSDYDEPPGVNNPLPPGQSNPLSPEQYNPLPPRENNQLPPEQSSPLPPGQNNPLSPEQSSPLPLGQRNPLPTEENNQLPPGQSNPLPQGENNQIPPNTLYATAP